MDIDKPLKQYLNPDNFEDRMQEAEDALGANASASVRSLDQLAGNTGTQVVGNLISPAPGVSDMEVTSTDFTGTFVSGDGVTFGGTVYNIGGVNAGVLQWGARQNDGTIKAGGGTITLDGGGISILSATDTAAITPERTIQYKDDGGNTAFYMSAWVDPTNEANYFQILGGSSAAYPTHGTGIDLLAQTDFGNAANLVLQSDTSGASSAAITADTVNINDTAYSTFGRLYVGSGFLGLGNPTTLTISGGVVTATKSYHLIDTEAAAATDNLDTINGGNTGDILVLRSVVGTRDPTLTDGVGNLVLAGNFTLSTNSDTIVLMKSGTSWFELSRSDNA